MKKTIYLLVWTLMISFKLKAQGFSESVYAEIGGPGITSFNYDMRFTKKSGGIGGRIGIGGWKFDNDGVLYIPMGLNYLLSSDQKHYFELGAGITFLSPKDIINGQFDKTFGHLVFGYRLQPINSGFTFRAFLNPVFNKDFFIPYYAGLSFGYKF